MINLYYIFLIRIATQGVASGLVFLKEIINFYFEKCF